MNDILNQELNYIAFRKIAKPISDYEVEETYQKIKDMKYVEISNYMLLHRFLVGVKRKEIKQFNFIVHDLDDSVYQEIVRETGELSYHIWETQILNMILRYNEELL